METAPWLAFWPGLCLTIVIFSLNMFGDALRDLLDPRLRGAVGGGGFRARGARLAKKSQDRKQNQGSITKVVSLRGAAATKQSRRSDRLLLISLLHLHLSLFKLRDIVVLRPVAQGIVP